ncbi:cytidine deaminase [Xylanibacter muris]|uniref:Cytidine deaminase n=1 Tax=Xylanibacter muris TaxID=2736290 RepID=A0ABX2AKL0_9BACT|nr:cytidine deaminase [Xylanibacter muris]NPD91423.1 cytidine deaminase [Xylanibacter muris]
MERKILESAIEICSYDELPADDRKLVDMAVEMTSHSYSVYSHFNVGSALLLDNGEIITGCNQENVAFSVTVCAERSALFAAGSRYPDVPVRTIAIAARGTDGELLENPISPCGTCRQAMIETEIRFGQELRILLHGRKNIYIIEGIKNLMPLSFKQL